MPNKIWVEAYRPSALDGYIFQNDNHKRQVENFIQEQSIPHLLLSGHRGTGKTTLAFVLKHELGVEDVDFKVLNASDNNSIDVIRGDIKSFAQTMPTGEFKIVFLDEADYLTANAQAALRGMMEQFAESVRFILTCNKPHRIIPELKSRCHELIFDTFDRKEMLQRASKILKAEGIKVDKDSAPIIKEFVDQAYPDMRKLIQLLQVNSHDGVLHEGSDITKTEAIAVDMIDQLGKGKWMQVRESIVQNVEGDEWEEIYRFFYDNLDQVDGFDNADNWKKGIILIADALHRHALVADPEINFSAFMIKLSGVVHG